MKVLFFTLYPEFAPSSRFRVHQFLGYLRNNGFDCTVCPAITFELYRKFYGLKHKTTRLFLQCAELYRRIKDIFSSRNYDVVFLQKGLLSISLYGMEQVLLLQNKNIIFDIDDAVHLYPPQDMPRLFSFLEDKKQIEKIVRVSSAVIAGNKYLATAVSKYNNNTFIIPTCVDTEYFKPAGRINNENKVNIFWTGNRSGNFRLTDLANVISKLAAKYRIRFTILSDSEDFIDFLRFHPAEVVFKKWHKDNELPMLQSADIGIMPLRDTPWDRGKCAFKALLYMSVGVPVVSSPVGAICDIIKEDESGFFATGDDEWINKLSRLIEDADARKQIGLQGRQVVEKYFSLKVNAPKLKYVLETTANRKSNLQ